MYLHVHKLPHGLKAVLYVCISGIQIVCTTQEASEGEYWVIVGVPRGSTIAYSMMQDHTILFTYAHPIVNSVNPNRGPKAGGTEITIVGSNLDISSPGVAQVYIGDIQCDIQYVKIYCISIKIFVVHY